ncbi:MAG: hypothetical protein FJX84_09380 [Bacteroidetes bacterium]|nr:hypothetical protein [Bacteroidota bacterium]MBM3456417.1 hypothetical protein [Bacteroidota bacterium]
MKKTFSLFLLLLVSNLKAQVWFDFGLNGSLGSGSYLGNSFFSDSRFNVVPKLNNSFALKIGVNPSNKHSAVIELGYGKRAYAIYQAFVPGQNDHFVLTQQINFSGFQGALLYRNTNEGTFIEVGPMFGMMHLKHQELSKSIFQLNILIRPI